ncbi:RNA exonuclease 3 [Sarocladium implicatum]|nr:RNA exonuclease 3 [Sarocladium implicatum]
MSLALKHIPCPAGNNCTAFQCIFGHPNQTPKATGAPKQDEAITPVDTQQDGPRKRQRLDSLSSSSVANRDGAKKQKVTAHEAVDKESNDTLLTANRPISPPPLKKHAQQHVTTANGKRQPAGSQQPATAVSSKTQKPKLMPATSTSSSSSLAKKESLNPRHLTGGAPASHEIRLKLIRMLHQQLERLNAELKKVAKDEEQVLLMTAQGMITRALDEEEQTAKENAAIYSNLMKNKVMKFKRMTVGEWSDQRRKEVKPKGNGSQPIVAHSGSDKPVEIETGLTAAQEIEILRRLLTPIDHLTNHGYVASVPTDDAIEKALQGVEASKGWEKCDRCQQRFQVFPGRRAEDGALTSGGTCVFHWGKAYVPQKGVGDKTRKAKRYRCCGEDVGDSAGCFTKDHHVFKTSDPKRLASILNFQRTPENLAAVSGRAVCFDCEMGYTVHGMELIRLTATSWPTGETLLDVLVKPVGEILDLNSRFSGVWPEDMATARPWQEGDSLVPKPKADTEKEQGAAIQGDIKVVSSPAEARNLLFSLISPSTPLIGHGLENDLNAVRIVHPTLVDTILLYPHKAGLPIRNGLKALMALHLNKKIQRDDVEGEVKGHDSAEDARAAGELARLKVMKAWKDMKWEGWKVVEGKFERPEAWKAKNWSLTTEFIEK